MAAGCTGHLFLGLLFVGRSVWFLCPQLWKADPQTVRAKATRSLEHPWNPAHLYSTHIWLPNWCHLEEEFTTVHVGKIDQTVRLGNMFHLLTTHNNSCAWGDRSYHGAPWPAKRFLASASKRYPLSARYNQYLAMGSYCALRPKKPFKWTFWSSTLALSSKKRGSSLGFDQKRFQAQEFWQTANPGLWS